MKGFSMHCCTIVLVTIIFISGAVMQPETVFGQSDTTLSLRARKHNDVVLVGDPNDPVPGASQVNNVSPGDTIEIDMFVSNWNVKVCAAGDNAGDLCFTDDDCGVVSGRCVDFGGVRGYQIVPDSTAYLTPDCGNLLPLGWDAPLARKDLIFCTSNVECAEPYPICNTMVALPMCTGPDHDPAVGAFIKEMVCSDVSDNAGDLCFTDQDCGVGGTCVENDEFIFAGLSLLFALVKTTSLQEYSYGGLLTQDEVPDTGVCSPESGNPGEMCDLDADCPLGTCLPPVPRYIGTLILEADLDATGSFAIGINEQFLTSFLANFAGAVKSLVTDPLTINMTNDCGGCFIVDSTPSDCAIDARYPWEPLNQSIRLGWNSIDIKFDPLCDVTAITVADFETSLIGGPVSPPTITNVSPISTDTVRVTINRFIQGRRWTCFRYIPVVPGQKDQVCIGKLPADVNADLISTADDVASIIDHLNGNLSLGIWQCDADRSDSCKPADLLGAIDMLNGRDEYAPGFMGDTISEPCPTIVP